MKAAMKLFIASMAILALTIPAFALDSIVGYWPCDEGSGQTVADVVGGMEGTLMVGSGWEGDPHADGWGEGKFGSALAFDENAEWFVKVGTNDTLDQLGKPDSAFTVAYWINSGKTSGKGRTVDKGSSGWTQGWHCALVNGIAFSELCDDADPGAQVPGSTAVADNAWHHIVHVFEVGNEARIYVDGALDATGDISGESDIAGVGWDLVFGTVGMIENPWHEFISGVMDDIVLFNKALSDAEISELMTGPATAVEAHNKVPTTWAKVKAGY